MSKKLFTEEEIAILRANPYTYSVSASQISFTKEFKELFWCDYQNNRMNPRAIFQKYNYDPDMLGRSRITGFQQCLKRDVAQGVEFHNGSRQSGERHALTVDNEEVTPATIRSMQHKIEYLEQEIEFLKKISSTRTTKR